MSPLLAPRLLFPLGSSRVGFGAFVVAGLGFGGVVLSFWPAPEKVAPSG